MLGYSYNNIIIVTNVIILKLLTTMTSELSKYINEQPGDF